MGANGREWKRKREKCKWRRLWLEFLATFEVEKVGVSCSIRFVETVEYQGFQLSRYAAELAEREGIDVSLIKRNLDLSPLERIVQSQDAANALSQIMEAGRKFRNGR